MPVSKELADILVCPKCKGDLVIGEGGAGLSCMHCMLTYPVRDDIPIMVVEEATPINVGKQ